MDEKEGALVGEENVNEVHLGFGLLALKLLVNVDIAVAVAAA